MEKHFYILVKSEFWFGNVSHPSGIFFYNGLSISLGEENCTEFYQRLLAIHASWSEQLFIQPPALQSQTQRFFLQNFSGSFWPRSKAVKFQS